MTTVSALVKEHCTKLKLLIHINWKLFILYIQVGKTYTYSQLYVSDGEM